MNSSPASSYALDSSSSTRSASRAVISPIRYVSILIPASSIARSTPTSGSSTSRYSCSLPRSRGRARAAGRAARSGTAAWRTSRSVSSSASGSGFASTPYSAARSSSSYSLRPGSIRYASEHRVVDGVDADRLRVVRDQLRREASPASQARRRPPPRSRSRSARRRRPHRRPRRRARAAPALRATPPPFPTTTGASAAGTASSRSSMRERSPRNSKRRNISRSSERSGGASTSSAGSQSSSRSRRIVASSFESARLVGELRHVLPPRRRQLLRVLEHRLERAVLRDQLPGGLVADAGDAGDVVRGVALQPDEVRDLVRPDAVARLDALRRVDLDVADAARRHHQADVVRDELERVAVGRDDARPDPAPRRPASRAWRSRRRPPSPRTRGCGSRTPRRSDGSTGTARAGGRPSAAAPPCRRPRPPRRRRRGAPAACPRRRRRPSACSRRAA